MKLLSLFSIAVIFLFSMLGLAATTAFMMFLPVPWGFLTGFLELEQIAIDHMEYTLIIGGIIGANFLISFILEVSIPSLY